MQCLVLSASSSQTCLRNSVFAMSSFLLSLNMLTKLAMFTWVPSYLLIPFGLWSVRDFCYMLLVESCHALVCGVCSCSMLFSCSKHCFLMLNRDMLFSPSLRTWYLLHFCHACLNLLLSDLAIAQCSSFVKHLEWITAMCFIAMLECISLLSWCI